MHFANCFDFLFAFPLEAFEAYLVFIISLTAGITVEISWKRERERERERQRDRNKFYKDWDRQYQL